MKVFFFKHIILKCRGKGRGGSLLGLVVFREQSQDFFLLNGFLILKIYTYFLKFWCTEKFNVSKWPQEWKLFNEIIPLDIDLCFLGKIIENADFLKTFQDLYRAEKWRYCYEKSENVLLRTSTWNPFETVLKFWLQHFWQVQSLYMAKH